jgi:hypothetical protein
MATKDLIKQAEQLMQLGRYEEARTLLRTINDKKARDLLGRLEQIAPAGMAQGGYPPAPVVVVQQQKGGSCLKRSVIGCGALIALMIVCGIIYAIAQSQATKEAVARNNGRGTLDKPIAATDWMEFENGDVRVTRIMRPASAEVERMNMFNDEPAEGAEFVLVWLEVKCNQSRCTPSVDLSLHLAAPDKHEWSEPLFIVLEDNLDAGEALRDSTVGGWQVFEYPTGQDIQALKVNWGAETLYTALPE